MSQARTKLCGWLVGLLLWGALLPPSSTQASRWRPAHRRNQSPQTLKKLLRPKRLALLIGISQYQSPHWPALRYASSDVKRMGHQLQKLGKFDQVTTLTGKANTTRKRLLAALQRLYRQNTSPWDTIMVYISAHGTVAYPKQGSGERYVVTSDTGDNIPATALRVKQIRSLLERFRSRRKVLMLATCYTGVSGSKSRLAPGNKGRLAHQATRRSRTMLILSASSLHQPAFESQELKSDVYTHFFLRCLKTMSGKKWPASASQIHACAVGPTFRYVKKRFGQVQLPGSESRIDGLDAVYLTGNAPVAKARPKRRSKQAVVQVFRGQLRRWKIRFFRKGQKGAIATLEQPGDILMTLAPGRYNVVMVGRDGFARRRFPMSLQAETRQVLTPPWPLGLSLEAGARSSAIASVPVQYGATVAFHMAFLSARLGYWTGGGAFREVSFQQHQIDLQLEAAWQPWWGRFGLTLGGFVGGDCCCKITPAGCGMDPCFSTAPSQGSAFGFTPRSPCACSPGLASPWSPSVETFSIASGPLEIWA